MSEKFSFSFEGLDELRADIEKVVKEYPDEAESGVYSMAGQFTKDVNAKMPDSYASGKRSIPGEWHRTREKAAFGGYTVGVEIENTAPQWHLVENGHEVKADPEMFAAMKAGRLDHSKAKKKKKGKNPKLRVLGWAPGKGYCQTTRDEWENGRFAEQVEKLLDKIKRRHNL